MNSDRSMSLRNRLIALTVATVVGLCVLFTILLINEREQLMSDRREKVRNVVEVAHATVSHFEQLAREGKLDVAAAKKAAMEAVRAMRYNKVEYFWINDLDDNMLMHPISAALETKKLDQLKDRNGKYFFVEFIKVVKNQGGGFVDYLWPKPGSDEAVPKLSYVKGTDDWKWVIGSGIYIDDVDEIFWRNATWFLVWGLGIGGFIAVSLTLVGRNLLRTLGGDPSYASEITRRIAAGDLTSQVICAPGDTTSVLAGMKSMQDTLRNMIDEIVRGAEQLAAASVQLLKASEDVASQSSQQSEAASAMAAAVEEMTVSIGQVAENANEAHTITVSSSDLSEKGTGVIQNAAAEMRKISDAVESSSAIIQDLGEHSNQITSIVNTIREIADQTNLLALNAAIEAARAGEQGRGFAVVADEVRKLAERTSLSTTEIADMVGKIQTGTRNAVTSMEAGVKQASVGVALAGQAGESITGIRDGALRVMEVVNSISDSIREQGTVSSEIARNIEHIAQMSEEASRAVQHTADAARHMQKLSSGLHSSVSRFRLG
ncbi:methyl-accepting chemotaxis protein [Azoarcus sp. L1K30]|uniref:methyl-accepting chemotaxis protein n=1 Tax=Azoarcus sp. L1K30 TaxID=2820277 RepID=UPI001B81D1E5|nr:methyl-accepting chemotaxis protein [Azoarcus sp. L1K30]MBR0564861.1 methyl-accepting chemotaxis protein [Azoarcus sp. L1K30]